MVFSSPLFLFLFLPLVLAGYSLAGRNLRNAVLLIASLSFYIWGEPGYFWILLASIGGNYFFGLSIEKRILTGKNPRKALAGGVIANLALLIAYKYANLLVDSLNYFGVLAGLGPFLALNPVHLPIGISFFTFQAVSYLIDVYRKECPAQKKLSDLALYISMFPQLIAGPIVRYNHIAEQLVERSFTIDYWSLGIRRFIIGLGKKVLIANAVGLTADQIFALPGSQISPGLAWLGAVCYGLQIFYDFSGYSDMAIGLGLLFGFHFPENFNYPYLARSIREFWRRWHMTLSNWFRDYLFIPLGGSRTSNINIYRNLIVVFGLCGIWHGASWNFLVWGLYHGLFQVFERLGLDRILARSPRVVGHVYALAVVTVGWAFFRLESFPEALSYIRAMFSLHWGETNFYTVPMFLNREVGLALILGVLGCAPLLPGLTAWLNRKIGGTPAFVLSAAALFGVFFLSTLYLAATTYNPFIYFRF
ncbi:MAG: MBOAT family O-acyltransferase [Pseudomonadota bacterium]